MPSITVNVLLSNYL